MKTEIFKKLIKESVKEVLLEILSNDLIKNSIREVLNEEIKPSSPTKLSIKENINPSFSSISNNTSPISSILEMTAKNMTSEEFRTIGNFDSSHAPNFMPQSPNTISEGSSLPGGEVGFDKIMSFLNK